MSECPPSPAATFLPRSCRKGILRLRLKGKAAIAELEHELKRTRTELQCALRKLKRTTSSATQADNALSHFQPASRNVCSFAPSSALRPGVPATVIGGTVIDNFIGEIDLAPTALQLLSDRRLADRRQPAPVVFLVEEGGLSHDAIHEALVEDGCLVEAYRSCEAFLESAYAGREGCVVIDAHLPGLSGLHLLEWLFKSDEPLPAIMVTDSSDIAMAIQAMKAGATDCLERPVDRIELIDSVHRALDHAHDANQRYTWKRSAVGQIASLTQRQRQVMERVLDGRPNKIIAVELGISQRTVENHRAAVMKKSGCRSLPELTRLVLATASRQL